MSGAFTLARNSASSPFFSFVNPYTSALDWFKQESDQLLGSVLAAMALTQRLEFRQSQSLVMTPQLMQAIKLLQLSNLDLSTFVEEELERNPLLERADNDGDPIESRQRTEAGVASEGAEFPGGDDDASSFDRSGDQSEGFESGAEDWMNRDLGSR